MPRWPTSGRGSRPRPSRAGGAGPGLPGLCHSAGVRPRGRPARAEGAGFHAGGAGSVPQTVGRLGAVAATRRGGLAAARCSPIGPRRANACVWPSPTGSGAVDGVSILGLLASQRFGIAEDRPPSRGVWASSRRVVSLFLGMYSALFRSQRPPPPTRGPWPASVPEPPLHSAPSPRKTPRTARCGGHKPQGGALRRALRAQLAPWGGSVRETAVSTARGRRLGARGSTVNPGPGASGRGPIVRQQRESRAGRRPVEAGGREPGRGCGGQASGASDAGASFPSLATGSPTR